MKRIALPSLFLLLSVVLCLGRTVSDDYTANAIKGVLRLQESLHAPDTLQVSRAIATSKGVCIEYRSRNESGGMGTGFAVYKTDKDLVWVDNSWLWDQVCLVGKYGQRREGKDVTDAVKAAIDGKQTSSIKMPPTPSGPRREDPTTPAVQLVVPAARVEPSMLRARIPVPAVSPKAGVSSQTAHAAPLPSSVVTSAPTAQTPVATLAPAPATTVPATQATFVKVPVETPAPTAQASIEVTVVPVSVAPTTGVPPKPAAVAGPAPAALTTPYAVRAAPIASAELGTIRGVTIVDNGGALERKGPPPAPESLGDAARRLRQSKQR
jgi:hypothetical protein